MSIWGWLHLDLMWVKEELRGRGYRHRLLTRAEEEARRRGLPDSARAHALRRCACGFASGNARAHLAYWTTPYSRVNSGAKSRPKWCNDMKRWRMATRRSERCP
jgi:GNAT superfamily N-acetyltransferase